MRHRLALLLGLAIPLLFAGIYCTIGVNSTPQAAVPAAQAQQGVTTAQGTQAAQRNPKWAVPIEKPGLPNSFKVSDDLYRGAQPSPEGFAELKAMGIKTDINLRFLHDDREKLAEAKVSGDITQIEIPMNAWHPEEEDVVAFLKVVSNKSGAPYFVHCQHGADRTGMMVAIYRICIQGWPRQDALDEMKNGGFGFHEIWKDIPEFVEKNADIEKIKRLAGLTETPGAGK